jgi:hypothetical protein
VWYIISFLQDFVTVPAVWSFIFIPTGFWTCSRSVVFHFIPTGFCNCSRSVVFHFIPTGFCNCSRSVRGVATVRHFRHVPTHNLFPNCFYWWKMTNNALHILFMSVLYLLHLQI